VLKLSICCKIVPGAPWGAEFDEVVAHGDESSLMTPESRGGNKLKLA
jgi:hypothetical protein